MFPVTPTEIVWELCVAASRAGAGAIHIDTPSRTVASRMRNRERTQHRLEEITDQGSVSCFRAVTVKSINRRRKRGDFLVRHGQAGRGLQKDLRWVHNHITVDSTSRSAKKVRGTVYREARGSAAI